MASKVLAVPTHNHEVDDALEIDIVAEIFIVAAGEACADTVMNVHHTRHAVKSESVELILLHPEAEVREQESKDFVVTVIKEATKQMPSDRAINENIVQTLPVPKLMSALSTFVEVLVVRSVERVQPVKNVFAGM